MRAGWRQPGWLLPALGGLRPSCGRNRRAGRDPAVGACVAGITAIAGSPRSCGDEGFAVNRKRVLRLMQQDNLLCLRRRPFVPVTTDSRHTWRVVPNLARGMVPSGLDQLWVADITYIRLQEEFAYLAIVLDTFSRRGDFLADNSPDCASLHPGYAGFASLAMAAPPTPAVPPSAAPGTASSTTARSRWCRHHRARRPAPFRTAPR